MNTLACDGYVTRDDAQRIRLGAKTHGWATPTARSWPVEPELRALVGELGARTGESAYLAMVHHKDVVITDIVESRQRGAGPRAPPRLLGRSARARALGKAVLAHLDPTASCESTSPRIRRAASRRAPWSP
jgi:DNA-binding IclR family transcriptional regulator